MRADAKDWGVGLRDRAATRRMLASSLAIAAALAAGPARGAGFNATITQSVNVTAPRTPVTVGTTNYDEQISVNASNAVIDWTPTTGDFLPSGAKVLYSGANNFTVLNEVASPSAAIHLNGQIDSQVNGAQGGNIWFYNPGGIIVGGTAVFNVGSLLLTADKINYTTSGGAFSAGYGTVDFTGAPTIQFRDSGYGSAVTINANAQINADNGYGSAYVALVAPRVNQGGTVNVNGSAGYLALASADVTIHSDTGLFDISPTFVQPVGTVAQPVQGTTPTTPGETILSHTGTTNVGNPTSGTFSHNVYLVAIPKNDAVTMLVSGQLGYQTATSATIVNGKIILDAGAIPLASGQDQALTSLPAAALSVTGGTFNAPVVATATGDANIAAENADLTAPYSFNVTGFGSLGLAAANGHTLDIGGLLAAGTDAVSLLAVGGNDINIDSTGGSTLEIRQNLLAKSVGDAGDGGDIAFNVADAGSSARVEGNLTLDTHSGENSSSLAPIIATQGGSAAIDVSGGGALTVVGATNLLAQGTGAIGPGVANSTASGGTASISASSGTVTLGATTLNVSATGGHDSSGTFASGSAFGGTPDGGGASINATTGGIITIGGVLNVDAAATVTSNSPAPTATSDGGYISVSADNGGNVKVTGTSFSLDADANQGQATGGNVFVTANSGGSVTLPAGSITANGTSGGINDDGVGAVGQGGTITLGASGGALSIGALHASANGTGASATNSVGGIGYGGSIGITADSGGTISLASGAFTVSGTGGLGIDGDGGTGYGGTIAIGANSGGIISLASGTFYAPGYGGGVSTGSGSFGYGAGVGYGGSVAITLDDGGFSASGPVELRASGVGGNAPNVVSSDGYGGTASITVTNSDAGASPALVANFGGGVVVGAGGFGGNGYGGSVASDGGSGFGGGIVSGTSGAFITASSSGVITGAGTFDVGAGGFGGQGYGGGVGGNATGGIAAITASGGSINTGSGSVHVGAAGMAAAAGAFGGFGQGGSASVTISSSGSLSVGALTLNAGGVGGDTLLSGPSAFGGNGTGGTGLIDISGGGTLTTIGDLRLYIDGHGGNGAGDRSLTGNEGNGTGGNATLSVANGSATVGGSLYISAGGDGEAHDDGTTGDERGDGVTATINGGTGTGGTARLQVGDSGSVQVASLLDVSARGVGGRGWDGGSGGAGIGGLAAISVTDTSSSGASIAFGSLTQTADGIGGAGGNGNNGYGIGSFAGGAGGFGQGGSATLDVAGGIFGNGAGSLSLSAAGTGGHGGTGVDGTNASYGVAGTDGTAGGIGGDAQGGQVSVTASNGGVISDPFGFDGSLSLNVNATGGIGGIGGRGGAPYTDVSASNNQPGGVGGIGGAGGSALAGNLLLEEDSAGIGFESSYFQATATAGTAGITGRDGDGAFSQPDSSGGSATGGIVTINAFGTDGEIALGSSTITADATASGSGSFGSFTAGQIAINVTGTPDPSFDTPYALSAFSLYASNGGSTLSTGEGGASGFTLTASSTPVALGDTYITGAGDAVFDLANGAYVSAGSFDVERPGAVNAPGNILITQTDAEDAPYALDTASTTLNASGNVDFTGSSLRSSEGTTILAGEQNQVDGNFYGGNITGGDIVTTGDFNYSPTINLTANAGSNNAGDITLANVSSADAVNVYADGSATFTSVLAGTDAVDIGDTDAYDYSGAILISAANGITISNVAAAYNAIDLISQNGGVSASALFAGTRTGPDDVIFAAGTGGDDGSIAILAPGDVTIDTIQAPGFLYIGGTDALNGQFTGLGTGTVESDVQPYMGAPDRSDAVSLLTGGPQLTSGDITLGSNGGSLSVGSASIGAGNTLTLNADLTTTSGDATLIAGQPLVAGNANFDIAGTLFIRTVSGGITIGTAQAGTDIVLLPSFGSESASANIVAGDLTAGRDVVAINDFFTDSPSSADRSITAGDIQAGDDILLAAYDSVHTGSLTTTGQGQDLSQSASVFTTVPGSGILVTGSTGVTVGTVDSIDDVTIANVNHYGETVDPTGVPVPSDTVLLSARGSLTTGDITTGSALSLENQGGAVSVGAVAVGSAEIDATGAITLGGDFTTNNGDATLTAGDDIVLSNDIVNVGGLADFEADGDIVGTGATVTATTIDFSAAGTISGGNYTSTGSDASLSGDEGIDVGSVSAGDSVDLVSSDGDVTAGALIAGTNPSFDSDEFDGAIGIVALGNIDIASGRAYGDIGIDSVSGSVTAPTLTAGFRSDDSATNGEEIAVLGQGAIDLGTVSAPGLLYVGGPSSLPLSAIGDDPTAQDIRDNLAATPTPSGASVSIDTATVGSAYVNAGTSLTASDGFTTTIGDATLYATGAITGGDFHIAGTGLLSAVGSVDIGSVNAGTDLLVAAAGVGGSGTAITTGDLQAGRDLNAVVFEIPGTGVASQNVRLGDLTAGDDVVLGATGTLTAGTVYATGLGQDGTSFTGFAADSGGSNISLGSGNGMSIGAIEAPGTVTLVNRSETDSNGFQYAPGTGDIGVGSITAGGHLTVTNNGGAISLAGASAANTDFSAGGDVAATGPIESGSEVNVTSGGDIIFTSVTAGDAVRLIANAGGVSVDSIVAGTDAADVSGSFGFGDIGISAQADVHVGSGTAYGSIALLARDGAISSDTLTAGNRTDGSATAGGQVVLLADGTINAGSITAPGRLYVGGPAAVGDATVDTDETAQEIIAALDPNDPATGSDVFLGATTVGAAQINAGGSLTTSGTFVTTTGGAQLIDGGELSGGDFVIARNFRARSSGAVIIGGIQAGQDIALTAAVGDHLDTGALTAGRDVYVGGGDVEEITLGNVSAGRDVAVATNIPSGSTAIGSLNTGSVTAGDDIQLTSFGALTTGALKATGQGTDGTAIGGSGTQDLPGSSIALASGHGMSVTSIDATGNISLTNSTTPLGTNGATADGQGSILVTDHITAGGALTATNPLGGIQLAGITAPNGVTATGTMVALGGAGDLHVIDADATAGSVMLSANGDLTVDAAEVSNSFLASATGDMMLPTLNVPGSIVAAAHGDVTAHDLTAVDSIMVASANGALTAGNTVSTGGIVRFTAAQDMNVGNVSAAGSIFLTGGAAINAGDLTAGTGPLASGQGGIVSGGVGGTDAAPDGVASGFDNDGSVAICDDCSTDAIMLPFAVNYFGTSYSATYVSNNGYLTFNEGQGTYTPSGLGTGYAGLPIIAAFFADVDTRATGAGAVTYGTGTYAGRQAFGVTYNAVGYYGEHSDKLNTFQIVLTNRADTGAGNFDIYYNYGNISWETGDASGGSNGFGGTSAAVGYNAGSGNQPGTFYELPGSRVPGSFLNGGPAPLITTTNDGNPGQLLFSVRNGSVVGNAEPPTVHVTNFGSTAENADIRLGNLSGEAVDVHGAANVTVANVSVGDRNSGIAATGLPYTTAIQATGDLVTGDINGTGAIALGSDTADVSARSLTTQSSAVVLAGGNVVLGQVTTGTGATDTLFVSGSDVLDANELPSSLEQIVTSSSAPTTIAALATATATRVGGSIDFNGTVSTGNLLAAAEGDVVLGSAAATQLLSLDSGATIDLSGTITGPTLRFASNDIAIDTGIETAIGDGATQNLVFTNNGYGATFVGGDDVSGSWSLSNEEFGRLQAQNITINAPDVEAEDDLAIGRLDVIGTAGQDVETRRQNLVGTDGGQLTLNSAGGVLVDGAVSVVQAGSNDVLAIAAGVGQQQPTDGQAGEGFRTEATQSTNPNQTSTSGQTNDTTNAGGLDLGDNLKIYTPDGSIVMTGPDGKLAGTLQLTGDHVFVGSSQAASDLSGLADIKARSDRLAVNDGPVNNDGYIRANGIVFTVDDGLYVQSSGTSNGMPDTRAGFTVGSGSAILFTRDDDVEVAVNGRIIQNDGTVLTGKAVLDVLFPINNRDDVNVADGSTVNGCVIGKPCGISLPGSVTQIQDILDELTLLNSQTPDPFRFTFQSPQLVSFSDLAPLGLAPLIDEPVTGAGNEDLWTGIGFGIDQGDQGATTIEDKKKR